MSRKADVPMCVISIGFQNYVIPLKEGMKVVELMQQAAHVEWDHHAGIHRRYRVTGEAIRVELSTVTAAQIIFPEPAPAPGKRTRPALPHLNGGMLDDT